MPWFSVGRSLFAIPTEWVVSNDKKTVCLSYICWFLGSPVQRVETGVVENTGHPCSYIWRFIWRTMLHPGSRLKTYHKYSMQTAAVKILLPIWKIYWIRKYRNTEPVFVNLLRSPRIDSQPCGPVRKSYLSVPGLLKRLQIQALSPNLWEIDSASLCGLCWNFRTIWGRLGTVLLYRLPAYVAWTRICKPFKELWNRFPAWRPVRQPYLSYRPARLHGLSE